MHESILKCLQIRRKYHSVSIKIRGLSNVVRLREESRGLREMVSYCILEIKSLHRLGASQRDVPIYNDCCLSLSRNELGPESIVNLPSCVCVQFGDYGDRMSAMISFDKRFELNIQIRSGRVHGDLVINDSPPESQFRWCFSVCVHSESTPSIAYIKYISFYTECPPLF